MSKNNVALQTRPVHRMSPVSRMIHRARNGHATWGDRIVRVLGDGNATTRMLARRLGCQAGDIIRAIRGLRKVAMIADAGIGLDPQSHHKARFWALVDPGLAELVAKPC